MTYRVLVTGLSGSGKSALARQLTACGEQAISLDGAPGLCRWENADGQPVDRPTEPDLGWLQAHSWNWQPDVLDPLLGAYPSAGGRLLFACGRADNQHLYRDRFEAVFVLDVPVEVMLARLDNTSRGNDFGRIGASRQLLADRYTADRARMRAFGYPVDATEPVEVVANMVRGLAAVHQQSPGTFAASLVERP